MNDDKAWIERSLDGDQAAFAHLVHRYQDRLFATLFRVTGSREEAEDVAQETFVQAFQQLATFQGRSQFYTWLYRIAFNLWSSRRRRQRPQLSVDELRARTGQDPVDPTESPIEMLDRQEHIRIVQEALNRLDEDHRTILVLRELEEYDYDTIGQILDIPAGTVRSRLHRARLQLKQLLDLMMKDSA